MGAYRVFFTPVPGSESERLKFGPEERLFGAYLTESEAWAAVRYQSFGDKARVSAFDPAQELINQERKINELTARIQELESAAKDGESWHPPPRPRARGPLRPGIAAFPEPAVAPVNHRTDWLAGHHPVPKSLTAAIPNLTLFGPTTTPE